MQIVVKQGDIVAAEADTVIVNLFEGVGVPGGATGAVDRALDGAIADLIAGGDLKGKAGEVAVIYPRGAIGARRVLVVGLGQADKFDLDGVRQAAAAGIKSARDLGARRVASIVHGAGIGGLDVYHFENFANAIRKGEKLNSTVEEAHKSTLLCHLGNIAQQVGRTLQTDPVNGKIKNDPAAMAMWQRDYAPGWQP